MAQVQEANGIDLVISGDGLSYHLQPNAILNLSDAEYNTTTITNLIANGDLTSVIAAGAPGDPVPHQFTNTFPVTIRSGATATSLSLQFVESLGGFEDSDGNLYDAGDTFITFRVELVDGNGNYLLWTGLQGEDPGDGSVALTLTNNTHFQIGTSPNEGSYPNTLGTGGSDYNLTDATTDDFIVTAEVGGGGAGGYQDVLVVAKSGGDFTSIQAAIDSQIIHSGTAQAGSANTITLAATASTVDNYYNGMRVKITNGTAIYNVLTISAYNGTTKVATMEANWQDYYDDDPSTETYDIVKPATILVQKGEYDEAITLQDGVDIIAGEPLQTKIMQTVSDNNYPCRCFLRFSIDTADNADDTALYLRGGGIANVTFVDGIVKGYRYGLRQSAANGTYIFRNVKFTIGSSGYSAPTVEIIGIGGSGIADFSAINCIFDTFGSTAEAIRFSTLGGAFGKATFKHCTFIADGAATVDNSATDMYLYDCIIENNYNNANGHGIIFELGILVLSNVIITCTHADAYSIYASSGKDVSCYSVYGNRVLHSNITNLVANGFHLSDSTNTDVENITSDTAGVAADLNVLTTLITTDGDENLDNVTLVDGQVGQVKHFAVIAEGHANDTIKITPANLNGGTQITFSADPVGEGCSMIFDGTSWNIIANNGGTIA